jgi:hypothetical protein
MCGLTSAGLDRVLLASSGSNALPAELTSLELKGAPSREGVRVFGAQTAAISKQLRDR